MRGEGRGVRGDPSSLAPPLWHGLPTIGIYTSGRHDITGRMEFLCHGWTNGCRTDFCSLCENI